MTEEQAYALRQQGIPLEEWTGRYVVRSEHAHQLLAKCSALGFGVIGIEGFLVTDEGILPLLGAIADYSECLTLPREQFISSSLRLAIKFISSFPQEKRCTWEFELA